jgi:hypothetical protein
MMKLRASYVPEEMRSTIINYFRIPLNLFVCIVLYNVSSRAGAEGGCGCGRGCTHAPRHPPGNSQGSGAHIFGALAAGSRQQAAPPPPLPSGRHVTQPGPAPSPPTRTPPALAPLQVAYFSLAALFGLCVTFLVITMMCQMRLEVRGAAFVPYRADRPGPARAERALVAAPLQQQPRLSCFMSSLKLRCWPSMRRSLASARPVRSADPCACACSADPHPGRAQGRGEPAAARRGGAPDQVTGRGGGAAAAAHEQLWGQRAALGEAGRGGRGGRLQPARCRPRALLPAPPGLAAGAGGWMDSCNSAGRGCPAARVAGAAALPQPGGCGAGGRGEQERGPAEAALVSKPWGSVIVCISSVFCSARANECNRPRAPAARSPGAN